MKTDIIELPGMWEYRGSWGVVTRTIEYAVKGGLKGLHLTRGNLVRFKIRNVEGKTVAVVWDSYKGYPRISSSMHVRDTIPSSEYDFLYANIMNSKQSEVSIGMLGDYLEDQGYGEFAEAVRERPNKWLTVLRNVIQWQKSNRLKDVMEELRRELAERNRRSCYAPDPAADLMDMIKSRPPE